ncbi:phospholipase D-like domain-containing protein [Aurantiacibacter hainanensis]|uniref:phospholipase D-like domain-containing protein n=1 Tax=Aurantiacibacter hainanensis TaxID=3076114 RepID=UPI0030C69C67
MREPILEEGNTCWRKVRADKVSFIVDAADYFAAAKEAILQARHSVYLIGWEFDLEIRLRPDVDDPEVPDQLRQFLQFVVENRPELEIFVLQWRGAMLFNIARQLGSYLLLKARAKPQIHFRLDSEHPAGACHHQKIVVIDDAIAFCGGIDMTSGRWDTRSHLSADHRDGLPWHDMTWALDGEVARSLGELARWRWKNATGDELPIPPRCHAIWPEQLAPDLYDAVVGIARTSPGYGDNPRIEEIEKLWCAAIRSAERTIYIENQFLSSGKISHAIKSKLEEEGGPEIVIILPFSAESWLESEAMDSRRSFILDDLRKSDREDRLGVYHPVNANGEPIYVHAKLLLVDDSFVRVGSSNMASRSLAADSECDLAMEAVDQPELKDILVNFRTRLLAEHLGVPVETIEAELESTEGSVRKVIERLRKTNGRSLRVLEASELNESEKALAESRLMDPEEPINAWRRVAGFAKREVRRKRVLATLGGLAIGGLVARQFIRRP